MKYKMSDSIIVLFLVLVVIAGIFLMIVNLFVPMQQRQKSIKSTVASLAGAGSLMGFIGAGENTATDESDMTRGGENTTEAQKTYLFSSGNGMIYDRLKELLKSSGYIAYPDGPFVSDGNLLQKDESCDIKYTDLLVSHITENSNYDHNVYSIRCDWQSIHDLKSEQPLVTKDMLHDALAGKGITANTWKLSDFQYTGGIFILRPSNRYVCAGMDIHVVSTEKEFQSAKNFYDEKIEARKKNRKKRTEHYIVIVSEYITQPMLFEDRKFHLRLYAISLTTKPGEYKIARDHGKIITAKLPFALSDWGNKDIHDTHLDGSIRDLTYPDDFERKDLIPSINEQLDRFEKELAVVCTPKPYPMANKSYSVNGLDIMITNDGRLILIEVNDRVGFAAKDQLGPKHAELCKRHCEWLAGFIL